MAEERQRREIVLPGKDVAFLDSQGLPWESIKDRNQQWVLIHDYQVPEGYTEKRVTVALLIHPSYPMVQIDMVYVLPFLVRTDGASIGATQARHTIDGNVYQRWSRHRSRSNPWRPDLDDISSHMSLVEEWFRSYGENNG